MHSCGNSCSYQHITSDMQRAKLIVACQQAEEVGYNLALDGLMEAERQQALEAVKRDEEINRCRGAQSLQALQEQMAERTAAHANMQVRNGRPKVIDTGVRTSSSIEVHKGACSNEERHYCGLTCTVHR